jgi:hypothetical protein
MKRYPTPEQKAKAADRRAKFRALWKKVADMPEADRLALSARVGIVNVEGRPLSVGNQCLIALQCPGATVVGGFRQWLRQGRVVRKGEHGHMIWVPTARGKQEEPEAISEEGGESEGGDVRFLVGTVFDIGQTEELGASVPK